MENGAEDTKDPSGFLSNIIGKNVLVKLNSGVIYKGWSPLEMLCSNLYFSVAFAP
jgi:hypothetical protein